MPEQEKPKHDLIDVGEDQGAEIHLDEKGNPEKAEVVAEEKIEVEQAEKEIPVVESKKEEEVKNAKEELAEYSEGVQKRIAKLTRKMREAERQREEAIAYAQVTKKQKEELEQRISTVDKGYVDEFESRVKTSLAAAKLALKNAIESQNVEAQIAAQEQLAHLTVESVRLNSLRNQQSQPKNVNITPQQYEQVNTYNGKQIPNDVPTDAKAESWASKNTWFGNDTAMTYTAFDMHKRLVEDEGYDPKSDEYYEEIDKRIRLEFPHKFAKMEGTSTERAKPAQAVASAKRSAPTGRKKTVKLSPSQVAIAKRLGVPLEEYAKQLNITEGV
jgi:hypothetical protein